MLTSIACTFVEPEQEAPRAEADKLFDSIFGVGKYAVGAVELTPYEIGELEPDPDNPDAQVRRVSSWQGTFAAHPVK